MRSGKTNALLLVALALFACSGGPGADGDGAGAGDGGASGDAPDSGPGTSDDGGASDADTGGGGVDGGTVADWRKPAFCTVDTVRVEAILSGMTLERKAAQVLLVGGEGNGRTPKEDTARNVSELGVGGLFLPPVTGVQMDPSDTAGLIKNVQELAVNGYGVPLFVSLDHEGGHAAALNSLNGGTDTPGNMALGQARAPAYTFDCFDIMGEELNALGFNMDFAPVLDITPNHLNGAINTRGFSGDPSLVSSLAPAAVWGLQNHNVLGTIKHFPGVGLTGLDSHKELPVNDMGIDEFRATTFRPFREAIEAGAEAIMTGHIVYSGVDPVYGTSMSSTLLRGILRSELGYQGLVVTDSITMAGAKLGAGGEEPTVRALAAGNDMVLLVSSKFDEARARVDLIAAAVNEGRLAEADLDAAIRRILSLKMKYCAFDHPLPDAESLDSHLGLETNFRRARVAAENSVVAYKTEKGVLPLRADQKILFVGPGMVYQDAGSGWSNIVDRSMGEELEHFSANVTRFEVPLPPAPGKEREYLPLVDGTDVVAAASINAHYSQAQRDFLAPLFATGKPVVLLTLGVPYDAWAFPDARTVLNVTGQRSVSMIAAAKVLFGDIEALGQPAVDMKEAE
ncbi:MAG: glycoside hydrolase family 3 protein [Deltaproteobacteria bacterium]|nr:glycoside hydrolase family 3 protein [Deltaproteobacteria bacterium]